MDHFNGGIPIERRADAAFSMRHTTEFEPHLNARQSSSQHQFVEIAEVTDTEDRALERPETGPQRHVELFEDNAAERVGIAAVGHANAGQRMAVRALPAAEDLELPTAHRPSRRFGQPFMPGEDLRLLGGKVPCFAEVVCQVVQLRITPRRHQ